MSNRRIQMERFLHGKNHHKRRTNRNRPPPRSLDKISVTIQDM